jgi:hypothetical protein
LAAALFVGGGGGATGAGAAIARQFGRVDVHVVHILPPSLVMVQASQVQSESAAEEEAIANK